MIGVHSVPLCVIVPCITRSHAQSQIGELGELTGCATRITGMNVMLALRKLRVNNGMLHLLGLLLLAW